jgi:putative ABC transport system permease protein
VRPRDRLFAFIVRMYPREFRDRFGPDLADAYREARDDAARRGPGALSSFWRSAAADAALRAPGEHLMLTLADVRFALRSLRGAPVFSFVALVTLALGIGANTAMYTVVDAVAMRPLSFPDSGRLVRIWEKNDTLKIPQFSTSGPNYLSWRERARVFEDLAAWRSGSITVGTSNEPVRVRRIEATRTLLPVLRSSPILGRNFTDDEVRVGGPKSALLVESFWRERFGGDPSIVGRAVMLDGVAHTVVGVIADRSLVTQVQIVTPLVIDAARESRTNHTLSTVGRLRTGVSVAQAEQDMTRVARELAQTFPEDAQWGTSVASFYDWLVPRTTRATLYVMLASVCLVLLVVCSNLANLMLARSSAQSREIAVRIALGASRARIVRQVLTESLLLALAGGGAGVALAWQLIPVVRRIAADLLPPGGEVALNGPVLLFSVVISIAAGVLFGVLPALLSSGRGVIDALKSGGRGSAAQQSFARRALVVSEVALATMLVSTGSLLVQSYHRLQHVDLGFNPERITTAMIGLPDSRYPSAEQKIDFYQRLVPALSVVPGVESAGLSSGPPLTGADTAMPLRPIGASPLGSNAMQADWRFASDTYFATLDIPLLRGRMFDGREVGEKGLRSMLVSRSLAQALFAGDPLGRQVRLGNDQIFTIIGVVGDVRNTGIATAPPPTMYFSTGEFLWPTMTMVVRASGDVPLAASIRRVVSSIDPQLAVFNVRQMADLLTDNTAQPQTTAWIVGSFAALALLLAMIGVYGVLAYLVVQRTREIGVRMALGATRRSATGLVLRYALGLSAVGVAAGVIGALAAGPAFASQLYGISARDSATLVAVPVVLLAVSLLAALVPAWRATRVDPLVALRAE